MQIPPPPDSATTHFFWIALPVMLTTASGQVLAYVANKRRGDEKDKKQRALEAARDERFGVLLEQYPLHWHGECRNGDSEGPLNAENVRFPSKS